MIAAPRRRRSTTAVLAVTAFGLGATACGARLPGAVRTQAEHAVLTPRNGGAGVPSEPGGVLTNPVATSSAGIPSSGPITVAPTGGSTAPTGKGPTSPTGPTTSAAPTCSGGSDVGLTSSTLTLGEVASLSGPVSGLFEGAVQGGEAFANFVNSTQGGICGRQVKVDVADDGTNCTQDENATQTLAGKAFALSGTFALYDGCGAAIVNANPGMADIHVALDPSADTPANHFDVSTKLNGFATGAFHYYRQKYGARLDRVGTIVENIPSAISKQKDQVHAAESQGWHFVDSIIEQPTNSNFQNDFIKLCQRDHITAFFELTETAANAATMVLNEQQAGCPKSLLEHHPHRLRPGLHRRLRRSQVGAQRGHRIQRVLAVLQQGRGFAQPRGQGLSGLDAADLPGRGDQPLRDVLVGLGPAVSTGSRKCERAAYPKVADGVASEDS